MVGTYSYSSRIINRELPFPTYTFDKRAKSFVNDLHTAFPSWIPDHDLSISRFFKRTMATLSAKAFLKLLLSILLVVGAFLLLRIIRGLIPSDLLQLRSSTNQPSQSLSPSWTVLAAVAPFIAPFAEELTFRYLLMGKFSNNVLKIFMLFVQGILFGLIHWNNFDGNVYAMIPYMVTGVYFGLIYLFSKNIWGSIIVHWMLNTMNSMLPALLLLILDIFGIKF